MTLVTQPLSPLLIADHRIDLLERCQVPRGNTSDAVHRRK